MSRPKGSKNKSKLSSTQPISQPQPVSQQNSNQNVLQSQDLYSFAEQWSSAYMKQYAKFIETYQASDFINPIYANSAMKRFNTYSQRPKMNDLMQWLNNPRFHEQQLRALSDWLTYACEFYTRTILYSANILNFDYELIPLNPPDINSKKKEIDLYQKQKFINNQWLKNFRVKEQLSNVMLDVVRSGGKYYYLRHSENSDYLQAMPEDYCYIDGRNDISGYTYSMNMAFFRQFPESIRGFAPEFADWYSEFLFNSQDNKEANPYRRMPYDKSVIFKFDDTRPEILPPYTGAFKNALEIEDYQDLVKLKSQLQTFQLLYLEIPKDSNGVPQMDAIQAANYIAMAQTQVPTGTGLVSTPMEMEQVDFDNSQNLNNIIGLGANNYYQTSGVSPTLFGSDTKSAIGITNSIQTDFLMFAPMYNQFERFINYQLLLIQGKYNFAIKFKRRSNFTIDNDITNSLKLLDHGAPVTIALSSYGFEPWQYENMLVDGLISNYNNKLVVPQTAYTNNGKDNNGRPTSEASGKQVSDSADQTRSDGGNDNKTMMSKHICLNCGNEITNKGEYNDFCDINCMKEFIKNNGDEYER